jgi:hypothetical protein
MVEDHWLGAQWGAILRLILKEAGLAVIGLACAVAAAKLMRSLLFDVHEWDFSTMALMAAVLGVSALLASLIRATSFLGQSGQSVERRIAEFRDGQTRWSRLLHRIPHLLLR